MRYISKALSSRTTMILAYAGMTVSLCLFNFMYGNAYAVIALMTVAQFFYGMAFAASPALYADTVVYATWKSGKDASGWDHGTSESAIKSSRIPSWNHPERMSGSSGLAVRCGTGRCSKTGYDHCIRTGSCYFLSGWYAASDLWI